MKNGKIFYRIAICLAVAIMLVATPVSFAYWKSGVEGNNKGKDLNIYIGEGTSYLTVVDLEDILNNADKRLVPLGRISDSTTQTDTISFKITVNWIKDPAYQSSEGDDAAFPNKQGYLSVSCLSISVDGQEDNFLGVSGFGGQDLFTCTTDEVTYDIMGNGSVDVIITIKMNEPKNKEQYDIVAGKNVKFALEFTIKSTDDLAQPTI